MALRRQLKEVVPILAVGHRPREVRVRPAPLVALPALEQQVGDHRPGGANGEPLEQPEQALDHPALAPERRPATRRQGKIPEPPRELEIDREGEGAPLQREKCGIW